MTIEDFDFVAGLLRQELGIALSREKKFLVESRLVDLCPHLGLSGPAEVIAQLRQGNLLKPVTQALTRQEVSFFRERAPLASLIPDLLVARRATRRLRIWSTAAGIGQEPYSIAMELLDTFERELRDWRVEIVATEAAGALLERARQGEYTASEVQRGLPPGYLTRFFTPRPDGRFRLSDLVRDKVSFERISLRRIPDEFGRFDLIFCRNVLLYFHGATRRAVLQSLHAHLNSDGFLLVGTSETLADIPDLFARISKGGALVYRPVS